MIHMSFGNGYGILACVSALLRCVIQIHDMNLLNLMLMCLIHRSHIFEANNYRHSFDIYCMREPSTSFKYMLVVLCILVKITIGQSTFGYSGGYWLETMEEIWDEDVESRQEIHAFEKLLSLLVDVKFCLPELRSEWNSHHRHLVEQLERCSHVWHPCWHVSFLRSISLKKTDCITSICQPIIGSVDKISMLSRFWKNVSRKWQQA